MESSKNSKLGFLQILKGVLIGLAVILVCVLIFALIIKIANIGEGAIKPINQIIKIVGIFLATYFGINERSSGWLKGLIAGFVLSVLSFICFSLIDGVFEFNRSLGLNLLFGAIIGVIAGIITVNIKKKI